MASERPQYRLSFDRPESASRSTRVTGPDPDAAHGSGSVSSPRLQADLQRPGSLRRPTSRADRPEAVQAIL